MLQCLPVTALDWTRDYLLAGKGPSLKIFDRDHGHLIECLRVFKTHTIHGIATCAEDDSLCLIWGGSCLSVIKLRTKETRQARVLFQGLRASDWVLTAKLDRIAHTSNRNTYRACFVTAHDALCQFTFTAEDSTLPSITQITPRSTCLLYCAKVVALTKDVMLVIAGTIFGDVLVWTTNLDAQNARRILHQTLVGHEGSIFGIAVMDVTAIKILSPASHLIATCSDDRTIRLWQISIDHSHAQAKDTSKAPSKPEVLPAEHGTGFGAKQACHTDGHGTDKCLVSSWGHVTRTWSIMFVPAHDTASLPNLLTCGEDASAILWNISSVIDSTQPLALVQVKQIRLHQGRNLWSAAFDIEDLSGIVLATGGADGAIAVQSHRLPFENDSLARQWQLPQDVDQTQLLRSYTFLSPTEILIVSDHGELYTVTCSRGNDRSQDVLSNDVNMKAHVEDLRGFSLAAGVPELGIAFLSSKDGTLYRYSAERGLDVVTHANRKAAQLFAKALGLPTDTVKASATCVLSFVDRSAVLCVQHDLHGPQHEYTRSWLDIGHRDVITSFVSYIGLQKEHKIILGCRNGTIHGYEQHTGVSQNDEILKPVWTRDGGFDKITITDMNILWSDRDHLHLFTSARDASITIYSMSDEEAGPRLIHHIHVPNMTSIDRIFLSPHSGALSVCGFRNKDFVLLDVISGNEIARHDCNGSNRTWTFSCSSAGRSGIFAYTMASKVHTVALSQHETRYIQNGGHGREIKALAISPCVTAHGHLVATGANDTNIKLSTLQWHDDRAVLRCVHTLRRHNTGVEQLKWSDNGRYLVSSGGCEELFVWHIQDAPLVRIGVFCGPRCPSDDAELDLRITDLHVQQRTDNRGRDELVIGTVRSDSTFRRYLHTASFGGQWTTLHKGTYETCCLTNYIDVSLADTVAALFTATDGNAGVVLGETCSADLRQETAQLFVKQHRRIHQSAIHCAEVMQVDNHRYCLISGGDDNALGVSMFDVRDGPEAATSTITVPHAHAAGITGLCIIGSVRHHASVCTTVATCSHDQRLKVWQVNVEFPGSSREHIDVRHLHSHYSPVADPSRVKSFSYIGGTALAVCGIGLSVMTIATLDHSSIDEQIA